MPIYQYEILDDKGCPTGHIIELFHGMNEGPLTFIPNTKTPIRKIFSPPFIGTSNSERQVKRKLSNENLANKGFTKYEKDRNGTYHRVAGNKGPKSFKQ